MTDDGRAPHAMTVEEIQRLIGSLFLEIDYLRRQNAALREQLEGIGKAETRP